MKNKILTLVFAAMSVTVAAQTTITFDSNDYKSVGVYDTWEESPFRTGALAGNAKVVLNPFTSTTGVQNYTDSILGVQRSRFGSNTFGVRVDLNSAIATSETTQYVHALIYKPNTSSVMLVGLGKRESFTDEPTTVEQFWVTSKYTPKANQWCDMVFPIKTVTGVKIYSWVIVPDLASPHTLTSDFACYVDQIAVTSSSSQRTGPFNKETTPDPDPDEDTTAIYGVNFDKTQTNTRETDNGNGIRYLKGVSLAGDEGTQSYTPDTTDELYHLVYKDAAETVTFNVKAGSTYTPSVSYQGDWMHAYAYIDYDNDGQFTPVLSNGKNASGSEAVSYSGYSPSSENTIYNSSGTKLSGSSRNTLSMPSFTIPASTKPGIYRMRFKVDWNCIDAGGGDGSNTVNMQSIIDNGGGIVDVLLNVHDDSVAVSAQHRNGSIAESDGSSLRSTTTFNQSFGVVVSPAPGFENGSLVVKHGYNLSGEQYVNNNRQWQQITYTADQFGSDGSVTIPASAVDGEVNLIGNFVEQQYLSLYDTEALPTDQFGKQNVVFSRSFSTTNYNTVCLPFSLTEEQYKAAFGDDTRVYTYENNNTEGNLYFYSAKKIEANVPFLMTTTTTSNTFRFADVTLVEGDPVTEGVEYDFVGNYAGSILLPSGTYFISSNKIYQSIGLSKMKGYRAYIRPRSASASTKLNLYVDGTITDIDQVVISDNDPASVYTTEGVELSEKTKLQKGVYIKGGKKVITK